MGIIGKVTALALAGGLTFTGVTLIQSDSCESSALCQRTLAESPGPKGGNGISDFMAASQETVDQILAAVAAESNTPRAIVETIPPTPDPTPATDPVNPSVEEEIRAAPVPPPAIPAPAAVPLPRERYLIGGDAGSFPGRWCTGVIDYTIDFTMARAAGIDVERELALWSEATAEWTRASEGRYQFRYAGERSLTTTPDQSGVDLGLVPPDQIGLTYGGEPGAVPPQYGHSGLAGLVAGHGGLSVLTTGNQRQIHRASVGYVIIDAVDARERVQDLNQRRALYVHELGHALGLAHVEEADSVMNAEISAGRLSPNPFDRSALLALTSLPCSL